MTFNAADPMVRTATKITPPRVDVNAAAITFN